MGRNAVLVEFWDFARINSLRTLPYLKAWHERYGDARPARDRRALARATRSGATARPWPARSSASASSTRCCSIPTSRSGGCTGTGLARPLPVRPPRRAALHPLRRGRLPRLRGGDPGVPAEHRRGLELPPPLEPMRPEDAPGVLLEPQTADIVLPAERDRLELVRDWNDGEDYIEAQDAGARRELRLHGRRGLGGAVGREREPGLYEARRPRRGRVAGPAPARRAVHACAAASAFLISFGSMKRTSSWTTSNSETSVGAARAEELDQPLDQLLGGARAGGDADHALALEPLLLHLASRCRSGSESAPWSRATSTSRFEFDELLRADHQHQVALARHLAHGHLAVGGGVTDVVGFGPGDVAGSARAGGG